MHTHTHAILSDTIKKTLRNHGDSVTVDTSTGALVIQRFALTDSWDTRRCCWPNPRLGYRLWCPTDHQPRYCDSIDDLLATMNRQASGSTCG